MKRAFAHASKAKFIEGCLADGEVEPFVVAGDVDQTDFGKYGGIVFELFYRTDLSAF